jgi:hypothetical protein
VWIYGVQLPGAGQTEAPDKAVVDHLGAQPKLSITLHLSHEPATAALALRVASEFLRRWPGVAECAIYAALTLRDAERALAAVLGGCACIAVTEDAPLSKVIDDCGGIVVAPADSELIASISTELQELGRVHRKEFFDARHDQIVGVVPLGLRHAWIVRGPIPGWYASLDQSDQKVRDMVSHLLGEVPSSVVEVVLGYDDDEGESERVALSLFRAIAARQSAAMVGLFSLHLGSEDVARMLANNDWILIR